MAVIRCANGHFYDGGKFEGCPHCGKSGAGTAGFDDEKTVAKVTYDKIEHDKMMSGLTQYIGSGGDDKTISVFTKKAGASPVAGWLVCQDGAEKGRDYRLHTGRNFVGRADKMDIVIKDDPEITREDHCSIVYEPRAGSFMLVAGHGTVTFINGKRLDAPGLISEGDEIEIGKCKFIFIPYCKEGRKW
jgi:hypothetical protein